MAVAVCAGVCPIHRPLLPISELAAGLEVTAPRTRRCLFLGAGGAVLDPRGAWAACPSCSRRPSGLEFVFVPVLLTYF